MEWVIKLQEKNVKVRNMRYRYPERYMMFIILEKSLFGVSIGLWFRGVARSLILWEGIIVET
jgi:hypothetical protein